MKKSLLFAIGLQAVIMVTVLIPPVITMKTGDTVYLRTQRIDPRSLFRGDYVILDYPIGNNVELELASQAFDAGKPIYITVTHDRPAQFVSASLERPVLSEGQSCLVARATENVQWQFDTDPRLAGGEGLRQSWVRFPQIAQYFVEEGTGKDIEEDLNDMVAEIKVNSRCKAVVSDLELL